MKKKKVVLIVGFVILGVLVLSLSGYIVYDKLLSKNVGTISKKTSNYNIDDYITVKDFNYYTNVDGQVKKLEFKNLPATLTSEFYNKHSEFTNKMSGSAEYSNTNLSNEIFYDISGNVLSVYELDESYLIEYPYGEEQGPMDYTTYDFYSININLDEQKIITNQELLEMYKINPSDVFEKILNDIADLHKDDGLLIPTESQAFDNMSSKEFKKNINKYIKQINNRFDKIVLYVRNNNVYVAYDEEDIVRLIGLEAQTRYAAVESDIETHVLSLGNIEYDKSKEKANIENNPNYEYDPYNANDSILNKFLVAPMVECPNKTLGETIKEFNTYENLSAIYKMTKIQDRDYLKLKTIGPSDTMIAIVSLDEDGKAFIAEAEAESIKRNLSDPDEISLYSVLAGTEMLCN